MHTMEQKRTSKRKSLSEVKGQLSRILGALEGRLIAMMITDFFIVEEEDKIIVLLNDTIRKLVQIEKEVSA